MVSSKLQENPEYQGPEPNRGETCWGAPGLWSQTTVSGGFSLPSSPMGTAALSLRFWPSGRVIQSLTQERQEHSNTVLRLGGVERNEGKPARGLERMINRGFISGVVGFSLSTSTGCG